MKENIDCYIDLINNKQKDIVEALYDLTELEINIMEEKRIMHSIQFAGFPFTKEFDDFDFSYQPQ